MRGEITALHSNKTWMLLSRFLYANVVGCKWVYKIKKITTLYIMITYSRDSQLKD